MSQPAGFTALVPIKPRAQCKTRLARQLSAAERRGLARSMLDHVIATLRQVPRIHSIVVLSAERDTVPADIEVLAEQGNDLNSSLAGAMAELRDRGVDRVLVLPADLARVGPGDIERLLDVAVDKGVAIAPSDDDEGTNGIALSSALAFRFAFGPDSFRRHLKEIARHGARPHVVRSAGLGFDLDTVADLDQCIGAAGDSPPTNIDNQWEALG